MDRTPIRMLLIAGALSIAFAVLLLPRLTSANQKDSDILTQVLGGTADVAANAAYQEADLYFHAGVSGGCSDEHTGEHHDDEAHETPVVAGLPLMGTIAYLHGETAPKEHRHIEGVEEKELLPWFVATVRLNPHHVDAWLTGTYWYYRTGASKRALNFINDGIKANPNEYRLYLERGTLEHRLEMWKAVVDDMAQAKKYCNPSSDETSIDRKAIDRFTKDAKTHM